DRAGRSRRVLCGRFCGERPASRNGGPFGVRRAESRSGHARRWFRNDAHAWGHRARARDRLASRANARAAAVRCQRGRSVDLCGGGAGADDRRRPRVVGARDARNARRSGGAVAFVTPRDGSPRWLLLAHQLPATRSNARVKTWRRIQQLGAVAARNGLYVLPNTEQSREDFEWLRSEIVALGGEATLVVADGAPHGTSEEIERAFHRARDADYDAIVRNAEVLLRPKRSARASGPPDLSTRAVDQLRSRFAAVQQIDFFRAPRGPAAADAIDALERRVGRGDRAV